MCNLPTTLGRSPTIPLGSDWESPQFDREALSCLSTLRESCDCGRVYLDLSDMRFVTPFGLLGVTLICRHIKEATDKKVYLKLPDNHNVATYMGRMGFFQTTKRWAKQSLKWNGEDGEGWELATPLPTGKSPVLLEITKIERTQDTEDVVARVRSKTATILHQDFNYTENDIANFCTALSETCENICLHSQDWGFVAIQSYRNKVKMAVFDLGIGIRQSLTGRAEQLGQEWNDCKSILKAMEWGISRFDDEGRGIGLAGVKDIVQKWRGSMQIRSGTGKIIVNHEKQRGYTIPDLPYFPGTQICISLPKLPMSSKKEVALDDNEVPF